MNFSPPLLRWLFSVGFCTLSWWMWATSVNAQAPNGGVPTRNEIDEAIKVELPSDPAAVLAVVGQTPIMMGEVSPKVESRIQDVLAQTQQEVPEEQLKYARVNLTRGLLTQMIQGKMLRESFLLSQVATQAEKDRIDANQKLTSRARKVFRETEVPALMKKYGAEDVVALDETLREFNSSYAAKERDFIDMMLGHLYLRDAVDRDPHVSTAEVVEFYRDNISNYEFAAKAKWEQLSVHFDRMDNREDAVALIRSMGREAYYGGNIQAVARAKSHEPFAADGGLHDWTERGSLASKELESQIFSDAMPLNKMSEIIEDKRGLHIIRVLERTEAGVKKLAEVQEDIKEKLKKEKVSIAQKEAMERMTKRVPVWTLFPKDVPGSKPLPTSMR